MSNLENLNKLLDNYFKTVVSLESALIFDRDGLLITKKSKGRLKGLFDKSRDEEKESEVYGAITGIVDKTLARITKEYEIGSFGTGTFDTSDNRLVFTEAGPNAILLSVFEYNIEINHILPYCFLIAEKIAEILSDRYPDEIIDYSVPNLELGYALGIDVDDLLKSPLHFKNKDSKDIEMRFKLIVLGDEACGKTSLINKFVTKKFFEDYRPTLGISITSMNYSLQGFEDSGAQIELMIWDLAGQSFFKRVRKNYYQAANAAFVMYDITRRQTFQNVTHWHKDLKESLEDVPVVLIGNKIDLEGQREVSTEEGRALAQELKASFIETSAKTGENVKDTFSLIGIGLFFKAGQT